MQTLQELSTWRVSVKQNVPAGELLSSASLCQLPRVKLHYIHSHPTAGASGLLQDLHKRSQFIDLAMNSLLKFLIALSLFTVILSFSTNSRNLREIYTATHSVS